MAVMLVHATYMDGATAVFHLVGYVYEVGQQGRFLLCSSPYLVEHRQACRLYLRGVSVVVFALAVCRKCRANSNACFLVCEERLSYL